MTTAFVDFILALNYACKALEAARIAALRFDARLAAHTSDLGADTYSLLKEARDGERCIEAECREVAA